MGLHKFEFDRKRALNCKLVRASESHPGEFRYDLEIGDKEGRIKHATAYGKDMQDAISRHIWTELSVKIVRIFQKMEDWLAILWLLTLSIPASIAVIYDNPAWVYGAITFSFILFGGVILFSKYTQRRQ